MIPAGRPMLTVHSRGAHAESSDPDRDVFVRRRFVGGPSVLWESGLALVIELLTNEWTQCAEM